MPPCKQTKLPLITCTGVQTLVYNKDKMIETRRLIMNVGVNMQKVYSRVHLLHSRIIRDVHDSLIHYQTLPCPNKA